MEERALARDPISDVCGSSVQHSGKGVLHAPQNRQSAPSPKAVQDENELHHSLVLVDCIVTVAGANPGCTGSPLGERTKSGHGSVCVESQHWEVVKNC